MIESLSAKFFLILILLSSSVYATEVTGKAIAFACSGCHGTNGLLVKSALPRLKSRPSDELEELLLNFKYDRKSSSIMGRITKGYSDAELKSVALYFSRL